MTDVLILSSIAGHNPGDVTELTDRLQKHVDAGNAQVLEDEQDEQAQDEQVDDRRAYHLHAVDSDADYDSDEDTED